MSYSPQREYQEALRRSKTEKLEKQAQQNERAKPMPSATDPDLTRPVEWITRHFYIIETRAPITLAPYQELALREALARDERGLFRYSTIVWSDLKKTAKCVHPTTEFVRQDGSVVTADNLSVGDSVLSWSDNKPVFAGVSNIEWQSPSRCVKITTARGREIIVTQEHPFLIYGDKRPPATIKDCPLKPRYKWLAANRVEIGDRLAVGLNWTEDKLADELNWYLLGAYCGDGGQCGITTADSEIIDAFRERFEIGGAYVQTRKDGAKSKATTYTLLGGVKWLREFGFVEGSSANHRNYRNSHTKRVPKQLFTSGRSAIFAFLSGYLDTDGTIPNRKSRQPCLVWESVNRDLLRDCQTLLLAVGFNGTLVTKHSHYAGKPYIYYSLGVFGREQVARLATLLKLRVRHKRERLQWWAEKHRQDNGWVNDLYHYDRVKKVEWVPECPTVAIEIEGTHTHVTNGLVTHNTTLAGAVVLWLAANRANATIRLVGNDQKQADSRVFNAIEDAIKLSPEFRDSAKIIHHLITLPNGSTIESVPVDPRGEAGGGDDCVEWTELWAARGTAHKQLWSELTLSPLKFGKSFRWTDTYAGFVGESELLETLYKQGTEQGRKLDLTQHSDPDMRDLEIYVNDSARLFVLWNTRPRLSWLTNEYYNQEAANLIESEFLRLHRNKWTVNTAETFVPAEWWDACQRELPPLNRGSIFLAMDAGISSDCFALVGVSLHSETVLTPEGKSIAIPITAVRYARKWTPPKGGKLLFSNPANPLDADYPEGEIRRLAKQYNVVVLAYDPYQLHDFATTRIAGAVRTLEFSQGSDRMVADKQLRDSIRDRHVLHSGETDLTEHVKNANVKSSEDGDIRKLRMVKRNQNLKIDLAVALSMANYQALFGTTIAEGWLKSLKPQAQPTQVQAQEPMQVQAQAQVQAQSPDASEQTAPPSQETQNESGAISETPTAPPVQPSEPTAPKPTLAEALKQADMTRVLGVPRVGQPLPRRRGR